MPRPAVAATLLRRRTRETIEAAYRLERSEEDWHAGVLAALSPAIDRGLGVVGYFFDAARGGYRDWGVQGAGALPENWRDAKAETDLAMRDAHFVQRVFMELPVATMRERLMAFPAMAAHYESAADMGMRDFVGIVATDPTRLGLVLAIPDDLRITLERDELRRWGLVAAHLAAAIRIRQDLGTPPEAILRPDGKLEHAEPVAATPKAREALKRAVILLDKFKSRAGERDPDEALASWEALVAGRWSVIENFESDGRRYLVARRNDPRSSARAGLSVRESQVVGYAALGHSNKLIGYELGLSISTVAAYLSGAAAKLGCASRVALVQFAMAHARRAAQDASSARE